MTTIQFAAVDEVIATMVWPIERLFATRIMSRLFR